MAFLKPLADFVQGKLIIAAHSGETALIRFTVEDGQNICVAIVEGVHEVQLGVDALYQLLQSFVQFVFSIAIFDFYLFAVDKECTAHDSLVNLSLRAFFQRAGLCLTFADNILNAFRQLGHILLLNVFTNFRSCFKFLEILDFIGQKNDSLVVDL